MRKTWMAVAILLLGIAWTGDAAGQAAAPATSQTHNNVRQPVHWKRFVYTCERGTVLEVYLNGSTAKVKYQGAQVLMKQTESADGNRYSDGKVVWWGKGNGGFLQEESASGNGKMIAKDCKLAQEPPPGAAGGGAARAEAGGTVTGTVTYLQRMALPPDAVIEVQLQDVSKADAKAEVLADQKITLEDRQVPVPFELKVDPARIDPHHRYAVSAKILVGGQLRFKNATAYRVLTGGNPSKVDMVLKQVGAESKQ